MIGNIITDYYFHYHDDHILWRRRREKRFAVNYKYANCLLSSLHSFFLVIIIIHIIAFFAKNDEVRLFPGLSMMMESVDNFFM